MHDGDVVPTHTRRCLIICQMQSIFNFGCSFSHPCSVEANRHEWKTTCLAGRERHSSAQHRQSSEGAHGMWHDMQPASTRVNFTPPSPHHTADACGLSDFPCTMIRHPQEIPDTRTDRYINRVSRSVARGTASSGLDNKPDRQQQVTPAKTHMSRSPR